MNRSKAGGLLRGEEGSGLPAPVIPPAATLCQREGERAGLGRGRVKCRQTAHSMKPMHRCMEELYRAGVHIFISYNSSPLVYPHHWHPPFSNASIP